MFERYTERARRVIFFARYEASQYGSATIESEHMFLGLAREDRPALETLLDSIVPVRAIAAEVVRHCTVKEKISTSMELPLTIECKRALALAAEDADMLRHRHIGIGHLLLGLFRVETCLVSRILQQHGFDLTRLREAVAKRLVEPGSDEEVRAMMSAVPVFQVINVARSLEWYRIVLGFNADPFGDPADPSFAILTRDSVEIMLQKSDRESVAAAKAGSGWDAYIRIRDVRTFRTNLQSKLNLDVPIRQTVYGCSELTLIDPDGHVLVFGECN